MTRRLHASVDRRRRAAPDRPARALPRLPALLVALGLLVGLCALGPACAGAGQGGATAERSVNPGINDSYQDVTDVGEWVERFEREGREVYDHRARIVAAARLAPGMDVADVGTGTGLFVPLLADAVGPTGSVWAVDIVPRFLEHVRARSVEQGLEQVRTVLCTDRSVELPPASVDAAFLCDVYHHFEYPQSTLASIRRALRDDGTLLLVEFERIEGVSSDWILGHVRAGREVFQAEIEAAGFVLLEEHDFLTDNYVLRFGKRGATR